MPKISFYILNFLVLCRLMCEGCVVSEWAEWGSCVGTCILALRLRNRDVQRPTVQIKDGRMVTLCQPLYQIQQCALPDCPASSVEPKLTHQHQNFTERSTETSILVTPPSLNADSLPQENFFDPSQALLRIEEQFEQAEDRDADHVTTTTTQGYEELKDLLPRNTGGFARFNPLRQLQNDDKIAMKLSVPSESSAKTSATSTSSATGTFEDSSSTFLPDDFVLPEPGNFYIFAGIREPKKPSLIGAVDQRRQGSRKKTINVNLLPPLHHDQILRDDQNVDFFGVNKANETVDVGNDLLNNMTDVSNTLQVLNLTPVTSLEGRNESSQNISNNEHNAEKISDKCKSRNGKASCCRQEPKRCANGRKPQIVTRWFRENKLWRLRHIFFQPVKNECSSYVYNYCGLDVELQDQPMKFEQDCYESCFTEDEKERLPLFKDMKFENGFRVL